MRRRINRIAFLRRILYATARWYVNLPGEDDYCRFTTRHEAGLYAEGVSWAGSEAMICRRGPGFGRSWYYYPAGAFRDAPTPG